MKRLVFFTLILSSILLASIVKAEDWLLNPQFTNPALVFDTGIVRNSIVSASPDSWKWGYSCYKWDNSGIKAIDWCQVKSYYAGTSDYNVYIAGDSLGIGDPINNPLMGVVKLVQGNVWGGSVPWYVPPKMPINTGIYIDSWYNVKSYSGWHNAYMFDVWLKDDSNGNIMVLDLIFFTWTLSPTPIKSPWWDGSVFHYQAQVCGAGGWYHCNLNVKAHIDSAISAAESQGVHFNRLTTYIYQTEILYEASQAVGELDVGSFSLYRCGISGNICGTGYPECCSGYYCSSGVCKLRTYGGGGGGGCPILNVWNGSAFQKIELLNIHAPKDQDITYTSSFFMQPINDKYEIILHEAAYLFWDGSHINSVKLFDSSNNECHLVSAVHSKQGDVLQDLLYSDDKRVRTYPEDEIKLVYDGCSGNDFSFTIEGYNMKCAACGMYVFGYPLMLLAPVISFVFVMLMLALYLLILSLLKKYKII